jgi:hypothetical protein
LDVADHSTKESAQRKRGTRSGCPSSYVVVSAALMHAGIDLRDRRVRADVVDPVVVADVGLGRTVLVPVWISPSPI